MANEVTDAFNVVQRADGTRVVTPALFTVETVERVKRTVNGAKPRTLRSTSRGPHLDPTAPQLPL